MISADTYLFIANCIYANFTKAIEDMILIFFYLQYYNKPRKLSTIDRFGIHGKH